MSFYPDASRYAEVAHLSLAQCEGMARNAVGEEGSTLKLYESQWPCCKEFVGVIAIARAMMNNTSIVNILEEAVWTTQAMTTLVNELAVGRKVSYIKDGPPLPVVRLRSSAAFDRSYGGRMGAAVKDMAYQARAWAFECKWLNHTILPKWEQAAEDWRIKHILAKPATFYSLTKSLELMRKFEQRCMKLASIEMEDVTGHVSFLEEIELEDLARQLSSDSEKALIQRYVARFQNFVNQWRLLYIQIPRTTGILPIETLLAYTKAHHKLFESAHRLGPHLVRPSADLELLLYRAALQNIFDEDKNMLVLPMCSFDLDDPKRYRRNLLTNLDRHKEFPLVFLPVLIQRWQTNKIEKAVQALDFIKRKMEEWILTHGDDPLLQGIHLNLYMPVSRENERGGYRSSRWTVDSIETFERVNAQLQTM